FGDGIIGEAGDSGPAIGGIVVLVGLAVTAAAVATTEGVDGATVRRYGYVGDHLGVIGLAGPWAGRAGWHAGGRRGRNSGWRGDGARRAVASDQSVLGAAACAAVCAHGPHFSARHFFHRIEVAPPGWVVGRRHLVPAAAVPA